MRKIDKQIFGILGAAWLLLSVCVVAAATSGGEEQIRATLDRTVKVQSQGEEIPLFDKAGNRLYPIVYEGVAYLPVEIVGDAFNVATEWDKENNILHIGGNAISTLGGVPELLNDPSRKNMVAVMLDVDDIGGKTRVECLSLVYDEDEISVNLGDRQKNVLCLYGNQSGLAAHAVITDMGTGEVIKELDIPERKDDPGYQKLWLPVENVSRINVAGELVKKEEIP